MNNPKTITSQLHCKKRSLPSPPQYSNRPTIHYGGFGLRKKDIRVQI